MAITSNSSGYDQATTSATLGMYDSVFAVQWYRASTIIDSADGIGYSYISSSGHPNFGHGFVLINATNSLVVRSYSTHPIVSDVTCIATGAASGDWRHVGMYINKVTNVQRAYADGAFVASGLPTAEAIINVPTSNIRVHFRSNNVAVAELGVWFNLSQSEADQYVAQLALGVNPIGLPKLPHYFWKFLEPPSSNYWADIGDKHLYAPSCASAPHPPVDMAHGFSHYHPKLTPPLTGPYGALVGADAARRVRLFTGRL